MLPTLAAGPARPTCQATACSCLRVQMTLVGRIIQQTETSACITYTLHDGTGSMGGMLYVNDVKEDEVRGCPGTDFVSPGPPRAPGSSAVTDRQWSTLSNMQIINNETLTCTYILESTS
eukprot:scaffold108909_cov18-Tisochrysis_lutea.AAC.1